MTDTDNYLLYRPVRNPKTGKEYNNWCEAAYDDKSNDNYSDWRKDTTTIDPTLNTTDVFKLLVNAQKLANQGNKVDRHPISEKSA